MKRVLVTGKDIEPGYLDQLREAGIEVSNPKEHLSEDDLISELQGKHGYLLGGLERATELVISKATELELIAFLGVGYESFVATETATALGIAVTNTPGAMVSSVAEMTTGLLLDLNRRITFMNNRSKHGEPSQEKARDLQGQTVGIVGPGAIGSRVAEILKNGLGMDVVYHSRSAKPDLEARLGATRLPYDDLLRNSDVVTLHVPTTPETERMVGSRELALMKPTALLINTARAEIVDGEALSEALGSGKIAGAAFDGYYVEPLPAPADDQHGLLSLSDDLFLVTPHVASLTENSWNKMSEMTISSIKSFFETEDDAHIVNPEFRKHRK